MNKHPNARMSKLKFSIQNQRNWKLFLFTAIALKLCTSNLSKATFSAGEKLLRDSPRGDTFSRETS